MEDKSLSLEVPRHKIIDDAKDLYLYRSQREYGFLELRDTSCLEIEEGEVTQSSSHIQSLNKHNYVFKILIHSFLSCKP